MVRRRRWSDEEKRRIVAEAISGLPAATANKLAAEQVSTAVVAVLTPICVEKPLRLRSGGDELSRRRRIETTHIRWRFRKASAGAKAGNVSGFGSGGGLKTRMRAGRSVRLNTYATTMPKPAIMPSWAKPRYEVGVKDRNPAAAAPAAGC